MQNLLNEFTDLLKKDERFVSEGRLLKNSVIEAALKLDSGLIKLLLSHKSLKKHFFRDIEGVMVFDFFMGSVTT
jgi:adenine-specific DNA-methyltransferase